MTIDDINATRKTILRGTLSSAELLELGKKNNDWRIWATIIRTRKLNADQLMKISEKKNLEFWYIQKLIIETGFIDAKQMMKIGEKFNNPNVWRAIIDTGKLNETQKETAGKIADSAYVWEAIAQQNNTKK